MSVATDLAEVRARIDAACAACGRDPRAVTLVAVSKTKSDDAIREAFGAGQRAFGESYAQELASKAESLADLDGVEWHFIGHLQSNKAKLVARHATMVHAIDSVAIARELGKRAASAGRASPLAVLLEVNVSGEASKHGIAPSEIAEAMDAVRAIPQLALRGLMTMPPIGDREEARKVFGALASLRNLHGGAKELPDLSMGMSGDFEEGIACGATIVRVGSAIFGDR